MTLTPASGFRLCHESGKSCLNQHKVDLMNRVKIHTGRIAARWPASLLLLSLLSVVPAASRAAEQTRAEQPACGTQQADPAAANPETLVRALYAIVSAPAHGTHDWARLERLHAPGAMITPTQHRAAVAFAAAPQALSTFVELNQRLFADRGFHEREIFQRVERFGHIAHVWSGYETREHPGGPVQRRGINSFQLLHDGQRWCVLSATWDSETADHPMTAGDAVDGFK
ncbi:hypothetical protein PO883_17160 [Massilia sp. DJPM01]|uniref:hypothetical protein n=1 Tax=Massilia sp. DJPM01 TaxID=3024404 RepID=UPI00259DB0EB|nr:hypothetical protein [Massilia sp. DJPM01]MDM5178933.1 hypothetical protein [Massilia sp. DJPM01]